MHTWNYGSFCFLIHKVDEVRTNKLQVRSRKEHTWHLNEGWKKCKTSNLSNTRCSPPHWPKQKTDAIYDFNQVNLCLEVTIDNGRQLHRSLKSKTENVSIAAHNLFSPYSLHGHQKIKAVHKITSVIHSCLNCQASGDIPFPEINQNNALEADQAAKEKVRELFVRKCSQHL